MRNRLNLSADFRSATGLVPCSPSTIIVGPLAVCASMGAAHMSSWSCAWRVACGTVLLLTISNGVPGGEATFGDMSKV